MFSKRIEALIKAGEGLTKYGDLPESNRLELCREIFGMIHEECQKEDFITKQVQGNVKSESEPGTATNK